MTHDVNRVLNIVLPDDPAGFAGALEASARIWCVASGNRHDAPLYTNPPVYGEIIAQARQAVAKGGFVILCSQKSGTETLEKKKTIVQADGSEIKIPAVLAVNPFNHNRRIHVGAAVVSQVLPKHKDYLEELTAQLTQGFFYLGRIAVLPHYEGQGIFPLLQQKAIETAFQQGAPCVVLSRRSESIPHDEKWADKLAAQYGEHYEVLGRANVPERPFSETMYIIQNPTLQRDRSRDY